jgi:peptidylprolyl isomerase
MKRSVLICSIAVAAVLSAVAAGCGDGPDEPEGSATSTSTPTAAAAGTPITLDNPTVTASGLQYVDDVVGTGATPTETSMVTVHYVGWLAENGQQFESSRENGQPATFPVNGVIKGFSEAVLSMKVGGTRTVYIPSALAYGPAGRQGTIPPNADLVFEIELLSVE